MGVAQWHVTQSHIYVSSGDDFNPKSVSSVSLSLFSFLLSLVSCTQLHISRRDLQDNIRD